jgi:hypothetical protein
MGLIAVALSFVTALKTRFRHCARNQLGDFNRMIEYTAPGFPFSLLVGVLLGGELGSGKNCVELVVGVVNFPV